MTFIYRKIITSLISKFMLVTVLQTTITFVSVAKLPAGLPMFGSVLRSVCRNYMSKHPDASIITLFSSPYRLIIVSFAEDKLIQHPTGKNILMWSLMASRTKRNCRINVTYGQPRGR